VEELRHVIVEEYIVNDDVGDRLTFWYETFVGSSNNVAIKQIDDDECPGDIEYRPTASMEKVPLTIAQVKMKVTFQAGDDIVEDVNCDSKFMLEQDDSIGESIRAKMPWVPANDTIYLFMDNAGGHGTKEAIEQ